MSFPEKISVQCDYCPRSLNKLFDNYSAAISAAEARKWVLGVMEPDKDMCQGCYEKLTAPNPVVPSLEPPESSRSERSEQGDRTVSNEDLKQRINGLENEISNLVKKKYALIDELGDLYRDEIGDRFKIGDQYFVKTRSGEIRVKVASWYREPSPVVVRTSDLAPVIQCIRVNKRTGEDYKAMFETTQCEPDKMKPVGDEG